MSTKSINAELFRQLSYIADDENCMKKALDYIRKLAIQKSYIADDENCMKKALDYIRKLAIQKEKAEFVSTLNEICEQIKQAPTGQLQGRPLEEVLNEL